MCSLLLLLLLLCGLGTPGLMLQCCRPWATAACKVVSDTFLLIDVRVRPDQIPDEARQAICAAKAERLWHGSCKTHGQSVLGGYMGARV